jgi:mono/diheme cytochrome c family protein
MVPGSTMPPIALSDRQLSALSTYLLNLTPKSADVLLSSPDFAIDGALVYERFNCGVCHQVNGAGMKVGPALNGLKYRRERDWVKGHFAEPKKFSPGSTMPPYRMPDKDLNNLTDYLLALEPAE